MGNKLAQAALRISLLYGVVAALWILLSDYALVKIFGDPVIVNKLQTYKGWAFVAVTAVLLYVSVRSQLRRWEQEILQHKQVQTARQESELRLSAMIDSAMDGIITVDEQHHILLFNPAAERLFGCTAAEAMGQPLDRFVPQRFRAAHHDHLQAYSQHHITRRQMGSFGTVYGLRADGTEFPLEVSISQIEIGGRKLFSAILRDITKRQEVEVALKKSEESLARAQHIAQMGDWEQDFLTDTLRWSDEVFRIFGAAPQEFAPTLDIFFQFVHPDDVEPVKAAVTEAIKRRQPYRIDHRIVRRDGTLRYVHEYAEVTYNEAGRAVQMVGTTQDITDRKAAEEILRNKERWFRALIEHSTDSIAVIDQNNIILYLSPAVLTVEGYAPEELIGHSGTENTHPDDLPMVGKIIEQVLANPGQPIPVLWRRRHKDGHWLWLEGVATNLLDDPAVGGIVTNYRDITHRKLAERRLLMQAAVSRVLAEAVSLSDASSKILEAICETEDWHFGAIWEVDKPANVLRCKEVWHAPGSSYEALAASTREITFTPGVSLPGRVWASGKPTLIADIAEDNNFPRLPLAQPLGLRSALGFPILIGGEVTAVVDFLSREIHDPDENLLDMLAAIGSQIGLFIEHQRAQEEMQRLVSFSPVVIYALKVEAREFRHTWTSRNVVELTGYEMDEARGFDWWVANIHPEDRERVLAAHPIPYNIDHQILEFRFRRKDGSIFWVRDEKRLLRDAQGQPEEIVGSWADITERVQLEEQLRQSQKMEAIGRLAGGVAHDFNNLLTVIMGYSDLLMKLVPEQDSQRDYVAAIQHAGERAAALTRQLLAFSRKQILAPRVLDLNEVVSGIEKMLRRLIGEDILLTTVFSSAISPIKIDPGQIEQVIINLAVNARDAMPEGGQLTIETLDIELDEEYGRLHPESKPGRYTLLTITDTGCGMTPEVKARIFEPFFTTKETGKGTGLGLATVFGIVKQSEGQLEVYSQAEVGTSFRIYLPAVEDAALPSPSNHHRNRPRAGNETILLVEDEGIVRRVAKLAIETHGYRLLEASDGREALKIAENHDGPIDLLVTDVVMPEMSGRQLADLLQARQPGLKVLFISGYIDDAVIRHGMVGTRDAFLHKPFSPLALAGKVRDLLDGIT